METTLRCKEGLGDNNETYSRYSSSSTSYISSHKTEPTPPTTMGSFLSRSLESPVGRSSSEFSTQEEENDSEYSSGEQSNWSWLRTTESKDAGSRISETSSASSSDASEDNSLDTFSESLSQVPSTLGSEPSRPTAEILILDGEEALRSCNVQLIKLDLDTPQYQNNSERSNHGVEDISFDQQQQSRSNFKKPQSALPKPTYRPFRLPCGPKILSPLVCNGLKGNGSGEPCHGQAGPPQRSQAFGKDLQRSQSAIVSNLKARKRTPAQENPPDCSTERPRSASNLKARGKGSPLTGSSNSGGSFRERKDCVKNIEQQEHLKHSRSAKVPLKKSPGGTQGEQARAEARKGSGLASKASATLCSIRSDPSQPKVEVPLDRLNRPFPYLLPSPVPGLPDTICFKGTPEEKEAAGLTRFTKRKVFVRYKGIANSPVRLAFMKAGLRCGGSTSKARWHVHWGSMPKREILRRLNRCQLGSRPLPGMQQGKGLQQLPLQLCTVCCLQH